MKILVTGSNGFIGRNLISELRNRGYSEIYECDVDTSIYQLEEWCKDADFIFHLAGVNRPENPNDFMKGNFGFTSDLINLLKKHHNNSPVLLASSIQAELNNPYGLSKKAGEDLLREFGKLNNTPVYIYRFPNVFGKWSKPNYNTVIATFCYNIAREIPITINNPDTELNLVYIDDVIEELINCLEGKIESNKEYYSIPIMYNKSLGEISELLFSFKNSRKDLSIPLEGDEFTKKLYSTYLTFLPENNFNYSLKMNKDNRGSFTELFKGNDFGQISVNVTNPGLTKGNHWHHTKNEKFFVVKGKAVIRFRNIFSEKVIEYFVDDENFEVVDIPPGYTHNIENIGNDDLITIMWANESYNPENPDTFFLEV